MPWAARLRVRIRPYFGTLTIIYGLFATIFGPIPLLSVLKRLMNVWGWKLNLIHLPQLLLSEYERIRLLATTKLLILLRSLEIPIPDWLAHLLSTWVADISVIYFLFAISVFRGSVINRRLDRIKMKADPEGFRRQLQAAALLHGNRTPENLISTVERGLGPGFLSWVKFQLRIASSAARWPVTIKRNFVQLRRGVASDLALGLMAIWITMLGCALLGMASYILLSLIAN
jgi:hypothetical protein